ncbi:hypothetical protein V8B97DRAFT_1413187 [Scleroderma yunnanense]
MVQAILTFIPSPILLYGDYLCAKSTLFRDLFSGKSLDRRPSPPSRPSSSSSSSSSSSTLSHIPQNNTPCLLPSSTSSHPIIFLPVPDPRSIHLLIHWIYFGRTGHIETCLDQGAVNWEGLARNVEYLGLTTDIKVFLGQWYGNWLLPACNPLGCHRQMLSDDGDED